MKKLVIDNLFFKQFTADIDDSVSDDAIDMINKATSKLFNGEDDTPYYFLRYIHENDIDDIIWRINQHVDNAYNQDVLNDIVKLREGVEVLSVKVEEKCIPFDPRNSADRSCNGYAATYLFKYSGVVLVLYIECTDLWEVGICQRTILRLPRNEELEELK